MTIARRDGQPASPYYDWVRSERSLDSLIDNIAITDNDHWIHKYSSRVERKGKFYPFDSIMLVEVKAFARSTPFAQRDTLEIVELLLRKACVVNGRRKPIKIKDVRPGRAGCNRVVLCYGKHILTMSGDRPDNSRNLYWDDKPIALRDLLEIYRFERDPDYPGRKIDLRRHHKRPAAEMHPALEI